MGGGPCPEILPPSSPSPPPPLGKSCRKKISEWESGLPEMSVWSWGLWEWSAFIEMLVLIKNLSGKSLGWGIGTFWGVRKMIKLRLGDIRVDYFWNPFFQKCWGGFLLHFLANGLPKNPKFN